MVTAAIVALGVFAVLAAINSYVLIRDWKTSRETGGYPSTVPLIGGLAGLAGCLWYTPLQPYAWAPLVLDPGTAGFLLLGLPSLVKERWQFSSYNLLREFRTSGSVAKSGTLRLYKVGLFVLRLDFHRTGNELGISQFTRIGAWEETTAGLKLLTRDGKSAELSRSDNSQPPTLEVTSDFPTFQIDAELALAGLVFTEARVHT